jgi:hypothetical protein
LLASGAVWPLGAVDDLERHLESYRQRSARYSPSAVFLTLAELAARSRASRSSGELPARYVLGMDEPAETLLDHVRLVSLGARVRADERQREAEVYLADPDTGVVLVAQRTWTFDAGTPVEEGPALARRSFGAKVTLGALAQAQVVSKAVKRAANRSVSISSARAGQTSVTPQRGDWDMLPSSLLIRDLKAFAEERRRLPPRLLRPRILADGLRVLAVARVGEVHHFPAEQLLSAELFDANGEVVYAMLRYRSVAPYALDAMAAAVRGPLRFVSGDLRPGPRGWEIEPVAFVTDRMIVPDLASDAQPWTAPAVARRASVDPIESVVNAAATLLEEAAHTGLSRTRSDWPGRARELSGRLDEIGLSSVARRLLKLSDGVQLLQGGGHDDGVGVAWMDAAVRVELVRGVV